MFVLFLVTTWISPSKYVLCPLHTLSPPTAAQYALGITNKNAAFAILVGLAKRFEAKRSRWTEPIALSFAHALRAKIHVHVIKDSSLTQ
jgi:hypothetical protein